MRDTGDLETLPGPTLQEFRDAHDRASAVAVVTPMEHSRFLTNLLGHPVHLKAETLQRTGSYKIRGAYNFLSQLSEEERARGVVAASAGNHAQGVASAALELGIAATIFMPVGVALPKLQATRGYHAEVHLVGDVIDETLKSAAEFAEESGAVLVPPFDHAHIVAGQSGVALEILEQVPDVENVIVPVGGGGLISGIASVFAQLEPQLRRRVRVIGVQAANCAPYPRSLEAGEPLSVDAQPTIADGIAVGRPGRLNFEIIRRTVDDIVTVTDDDIAQALIALIERAKLVAEPAGAAGVAAALTRAFTVDGPTVIVLSGANIDPMIMERVITRGLAASARYLRVNIPLPDRPGELSRIAHIIAGANANVVEVEHTRHHYGLLISEVEIEIHMETRGSEHAELVLERLREAGYRPRVDD